MSVRTEIEGRECVDRGVAAIEVLDYWETTVKADWPYLVAVIVYAVDSESVVKSLGRQRQVRVATYQRAEAGELVAKMSMIVKAWFV